MSDTSEAPSLASHVRRVRVPSQASDVDQFLDELFLPVLDGNLDELSDARSLTASIKGTPAKDVNDFVNSFMGDDAVITAEELAKKIKGGGNMDIPNQNGGFNFSPMMSSPMMVPVYNSSQPVRPPQSPPLPGFVPVPIFNMQGPSIPQFPNSPPNNASGDMATYQQNLQRAFLQSAMAQNIQIQQQLLAQNQALQQLLVQSPNQSVSIYSKHLNLCFRSSKTEIAEFYLKLTCQIISRV